MAEHATSERDNTRHRLSDDRVGNYSARRGRPFDLPLAQFKNGTAHVERMKERPSVQKRLAYEKDVLSAFAKAA